MIWSLAAAAVLGAVAILTKGSDVIWRIAGTTGTTAACAALMMAARYRTKVMAVRTTPTLLATRTGAIVRPRRNAIAGSAQPIRFAMVIPHVSYGREVGIRIPSSQMRIKANNAAKSAAVIPTIPDERPDSLSRRIDAAIYAS